MFLLQDENNIIYPMVYKENYIHREKRLSSINRFEFVSWLSMKEFKNNKQQNLKQQKNINLIICTILIQIINYIINMFF